MLEYRLLPAISHVTFLCWARTILVCIHVGRKKMLRKSYKPFFSINSFAKIWNYSCLGALPLVLQLRQKGMGCLEFFLTFRRNYFFSRTSTSIVVFFSVEKCSSRLLNRWVPRAKSFEFLTETIVLLLPIAM